VVPAVAVVVILPQPVEPVVQEQQIKVAQAVTDPAHRMAVAVAAVVLPQPVVIPRFPVLPAVLVVMVLLHQLQVHR
jgi:hypothetical protein